MPRRRRSDGPAGGCKTRVVNNNVHHAIEDHGLDDDLDDCGALGSPNGQGHQPLQRNAANARERARMRVLSRAFCRLKTTLPWVPADTKLSKLDTLRLATSYIAHLRDVLLLGEAPPSGTGSSQHPGTGAINLTWPFTFSQPGVPGAPGQEPWISRGAASASSRASSASSRLPVVPEPAIPACSGSSSNASSSGADDDGPIKDEDVRDHDDSDERLLCRRGLSGGRLVELPQACHPFQPDYHPFLQRYVDSTGPVGQL